MSNILNSEFRYVPPERQLQDGVLSIWLRRREAEREAKFRLEYEAADRANVLALSTKRNARG